MSLHRHPQHDQHREQQWDESLRTGQRAVRAVTNFLESDLVKRSWFHTQLVQSVEEEPRYQPLGIDLLWVVRESSFLRCITVEVKGDRNDQTGNFFFETVSDIERTTLGGFVVSRAEWLCYYFVNSGTLYCLPMQFVKPWFVENKHRFKERRAYSRRGQATWSTAGHIVPIKTVLAEVAQVKAFRWQRNAWRGVT